MIDEADRMMEDLKQDWLAALENAVITPAPQAYFPLNRSAPGPLSIARYCRIVPELKSAWNEQFLSKVMR